MDELKDLSQQLPDESHLNSEWKPTHLLEDEHARDQQACSWVGSYTIGKDYWATEANGVNEEPSKTVSIRNIFKNTISVNKCKCCSVNN